MKKFIWLVIFLVPYRLTGQQHDELGDPIAIISLPNLDLVSFDTKDNLYLSTTTGDIFQYDWYGTPQNLFSPTRQGRLNQLEAAWTVNIFSFSADLQEYRILDRFLNPLAEKGFQLTDINLAKAASLGNNNVIWVWDESDLSLKSLDYLRNLIKHSQPLNLILKSNDLEVREIREFQNRLFMNIPKEGVYLFDNQANLIKKIPLKIDQRMCYFREHLLWIEGGYLWSVSLQTQAIRKLVPVPPFEFNTIQVGQERIALAGKDKLFLFESPKWLKTLE